jgi:hypothetical protein
MLETRKPATFGHQGCIVVRYIPVKVLFRAISKLGNHVSAASCCCRRLRMDNSNCCPVALKAAKFAATMDPGAMQLAAREHASV